MLNFRPSRLTVCAVICGLGTLSQAGAQIITEYTLPVPFSNPSSLTLGPDDALWFTENGQHQIGRIDTAGVITEFPLPNPTTIGGIASGPDGNLWFTEPFAAVVARMTPTGVVTEFSVAGAFPSAITAGPDGRLWFGDDNHRIGAITTDGVTTFYDLPVDQVPWAITAGPDGNVWFTDGFFGIVSRITPAGVATHYTTRRFTAGIAQGADDKLWLADAAEPLFGVDRVVEIGTDLSVREFPLPYWDPIGSRGTNGIALGPDGAAWITELNANSIGRFTAAGEYEEFDIPTAGSYPWAIVAGPDGAMWFTEQNKNKIGRISIPAFTAAPPTLATSDTSGILEPGETFTLSPAWRNNGAAPAALEGQALSFVGPSGPYLIQDGAADYGTIAAGETGRCLDTNDCYLLGIFGSPRPLLHWDAFFTEGLTTGQAKTWTLHVGDSFADVPRSFGFYASVETVFHNGVTIGCGNSNFCPDAPVTRAQMTVFVLKGLHGRTYVAFGSSGTVFADVPAAAFAAAWIERAFYDGITAGCGNGNFCPDQPVTRAQMAVFLVRAQHLSGYVPPAATGTFADVPPGSFAADWIEQLANQGATAGCGGGNYCPDALVTRGQMAAFLELTFSLSLYSPE